MKSPKGGEQPDNSKKKKTKEPYKITRRVQQVLIAKVHRAIQSGEYPTAPQMALDFETSERTIKRIIEYLRDEEGLPIDFDFVRNGYFYTEPVEDFPNVRLTEGDLFMMMLAHRSLSSYQGTAAGRALMNGMKKLAKLLPDSIVMNVEDLEERITFHNGIETIYNPQIFEAFARAARKRRQIKIYYQTPGKEALWRTVDPYAFARVGGEWYLFAHDSIRGHVVKFVPQRTLAVKETGKKVVLPKGFSVAKFLKGSFGVFSSEGEFDVVVHFTNKVAHRIREKRWPCQQKIVELEGGALELHLKLSSLVEVAPWICDFEGEAYPVAPAQLKERYICAAQKMLAWYKE